MAVIGAQVTLGPGCSVGAHAVVEGPTVLGAGNVLGPHVVLGTPPQRRDDHLLGSLRVGDHNTFREFCTVHRGSDDSATEIGSRCMLMAYSHVGHDCHLGDQVEMANGVQLGGHVDVGTGAVLGGLAAVHQFCRVGQRAMVAGGAIVVQDVPPFCQVAGDRARLYGVNDLGLRRAGFDQKQRRAIAQALRILRRSADIQDALQTLSSMSTTSDCVGEILEFVRASQRGLCRPVSRRR